MRRWTVLSGVARNCLLCRGPSASAATPRAGVGAAVELAAALLPDVAVFDVRMSASGIVAVARVHDVAPGTNFVVLTGEADALSESDCVRLGPSAYLVNGVSNTTITTAIRRAVGSRRGRGRLTRFLGDAVGGADGFGLHRQQLHHT